MNNNDDALTKMDGVVEASDESLGLLMEAALKNLEDQAALLRLEANELASQWERYMGDGMPMEKLRVP